MNTITVKITLATTKLTIRFSSENVFSSRTKGHISRIIRYSSITFHLNVYLQLSYHYRFVLLARQSEVNELRHGLLAFRLITKALPIRTDQAAKEIIHLHNLHVYMSEMIKLRKVSIVLILFSIFLFFTSQIWNLR